MHNRRFASISILAALASQASGAVTVDPTRPDVWTYNTTTLIWSQFLDAPGNVDTGADHLRFGRTPNAKGRITIDGGSTVTTPHAILGFSNESGSGEASRGDVIVDGPGSLFAPTRLTLGDHAVVQLFPGFFGDSFSVGTVTVQSGGSLAADIVESDGPGTITVTGAGSSATITGRTNLWDHDLFVQQGATVSARRIVLGSTRVDAFQGGSINVPGSILVENPGSHLSSIDPINVFSGTVTVRDGGTLNAPSVGVTNGTFLVSGANTNVSVPAAGGSGVVRAASGAQLHLGGYQSSSAQFIGSLLESTGIGSSISVNNAINMNGYGDSQGNWNERLSVAAGASLDCLSSTMGANSLATITGVGSTWEIAGMLRLQGENVWNGAVFTQRRGAVDIRDGGTVTADTLDVRAWGRVTMQLTANSLLSAHPGAMLDVDGHADFALMNEKIGITRSNFTLPADGAFHILSYGTLNLGTWSLDPGSPNFLFQLPNLPSGFQWTVVQRDNSIYLSVPAPTTLAPLAALAAVSSRRRR